MGFKTYLKLKLIIKIRGQEGICTVREFQDVTIIHSNSLILKSNCKKKNQNTTIDYNKSKAHVVSRVSTNKIVNKCVTNKLIE